MAGATQFPVALDTFPEIGPNTDEAAAGVEHDVVHENVHAAVVALQAKVGVNGSLSPASLDARVAGLDAQVAGLDTRVAGLEEGGTGPASTDELPEGLANKYFSDERAQDALAAAFAAGTHTNFTVTYDDATNAFHFAAAAGDGGGGGVADVRDFWLMG